VNAPVAGACKKERYRLRLRAAGKCPRCAKPSWPYVNCEKCRAYAKLNRILNREAKLGAFAKIREGWNVFWTIGPNPGARSPSKRSGGPKDGRSLPRFHRRTVLCSTIQEYAK
jgi:hypothetical protein